MRANAVISEITKQLKENKEVTIRTSKRIENNVHITSVNVTEKMNGVGPVVLKRNALRCDLYDQRERELRMRIQAKKNADFLGFETEIKPEA